MSVTTYNVEAGKDRATIELSGETKVVFSFDPNIIAVEAVSGSVNVSLDEGATAGDDGCDTLSEGQSTRMNPIADKCIYVNGTGTVKVWGGRSGEDCPFPKSAKGGGSSGGCNYKGTTTTPISNGSTTNPITIDGESYTAIFGDVVVYNYTEFVFDGTQWSEFGRPFDTEPTSGSANAVTSDGLYQRTPFERGQGSSAYGGGAYKTTANYAFAYGTNAKATANYTLAIGFAAEATLPYASAIGRYARAIYTDLNVIGPYNSPRNGDVFEVGNGTYNSRSNILEANYSSVNINGNIQRNGVGIDDYTTTERKIGKWIDGSNLYQRTFEVTGLTESDRWVFNNNILGTSNIDIKDFKGYTEWSDGTNTTRFDLNFYLSNSIHSLCLNAVSDLAISLNHESTSFVKAIITIKYTKESVQANLMQTAPTEVSETPTVEEDDMR